MKVDEMSKMISDVGFPIVACAFMYLQQRELVKSIQELTLEFKTFIRKGDK